MQRPAGQLPLMLDKNLFTSWELVACSCVVLRLEGVWGMFTENLTDVLIAQESLWEFPVTRVDSSL
jgi:hypothetical protein